MLVIARHGRTEANAEGLLLGRADVALDEVGLTQAAGLPGRVGVPGRVISSPLQRCVKTAESFGLPVDVDERWIELDYGDYDRTPYRSVAPEVWAAWRSDPTFRPPGGETLIELGRRVRGALDDLRDEVIQSDHDVVVVTHVSPIKAAVAWALAVDDSVAWRMYVAVASVTRIAISPAGPSLHVFNEPAAG